MRLRYVQGPLTSPTLVEAGNISIPSHSSPPNAPALGSVAPLDCLDYRPMNADSGPALFAPRDTIRYRRIFASESGDVPNYPEPGVFINYFLPDDESTPLRLEFADASGAVIAVIESTAEEQENDDDDDDPEPTPVTCDAPLLYDSKLSNTAGFHRYSWDMRHFGPWTEKSGKRYRDGPLAKPGRYAVRLITDEQVLERDFELKVDPRLSQQDVDMDDLRLQLQTLADVSDLLTRMRQLAGDLNFRIAQHQNIVPPGILNKTRQPCVTNGNVRELRKHVIAIVTRLVGE